MNELINHEAVYRTAPATPGLLKSDGQVTPLCSNNRAFCNYGWNYKCTLYLTSPKYHEIV